MSKPKFFVRYCPSVDPAYVTHRLIRNPNYGGRPCDVPGTCIIPVIERAIKPKFFAALEENVARDGFRNPILLYNTVQGMLLSFGGSRLRVARRSYRAPRNGKLIRRSSWKPSLTRSRLKDLCSRTGRTSATRSS